MTASQDQIFNLYNLEVTMIIESDIAGIKIILLRKILNILFEVSYEVK